MYTRLICGGKRNLGLPRNLSSYVFPNHLLSRTVVFFLSYYVFCYTLRHDAPAVDMPPFLRPSRNALASLYRAVCLHWKLIAVVALLMLLEVCVHIRSYSIIRSPIPLDAPFHTGCRSPVLNTTARENAVLVMLARNSEVSGTVSSVRNVQEQFNDNFGYPWVFLNDEERSNEFKEKVGKAVGRANAKFEAIPEEIWGYPEWIDKEKAKQSMQDMKDRNIQYSSMESYHHMCRFQSGYVLPTSSPGVFFANKSPSE